LAQYQAMFESGKLTMVEVLEKMTQLYTAKLDYVSAQYDAVLALLAMKRDIGTLSEKDISDMNAALQISDSVPS